MEADIVKGNLGNHGTYDVAFKGGKLVLEVAGEVAPVTVGAKVAVDAVVVIDAIEKAIPGTLDDAVLEILKAALAKA